MLASTGIVSGFWRHNAYGIPDDSPCHQPVGRGYNLRGQAHVCKVAAELVEDAAVGGYENVAKGALLSQKSL